MIQNLSNDVAVALLKKY